MTVGARFYRSVTGGSERYSEQSYDIDEDLKLVKTLEEMEDLNRDEVGWTMLLFLFQKLQVYIPKISHYLVNRKYKEIRWNSRY